MTQKRIVLISLGFLLLGLLFITWLHENKNLIKDALTENTPSPSAKEYVATVTPETYQPGRLFMIGHWADQPLASTTERIAKHQVAGVIIMSAPSEPNNISSWVDEWNSVSEKPLLIAIDQEGGPVTRLQSDGFIQTGQRDIISVEDAYAVGYQRGKELAALGINMNFAPVLDSAKNEASFMYSRVFADRDNAPALAAALTKGMADAGVTGVVKHFPGHDDTSDDSHFTLPVVAIEKGALMNFVSPFISYFSLVDAQALMTAHVLLPSIDTYPATLSEYFLTDFLRTELQFNGVIITDDMSMDAIDLQWTTEEATALSLDAGADLILFAAEPERIEKGVAAAKQIEPELQKEKALRVEALISNLHTP